MAKKKKTKVGNLISKVTTAIKKVVSGGNLAASATPLKARVGENLSPSQAAKAQAVVTKKVLQPSVAGKLGLSTNQLSITKSPTKSSGSSNYPGLTGNIPAGISFNPKSVDIGSALSSGGLSVPNLSSASAPTSADGVLAASRTGSTNFSSGSGSMGTSATSYGLGSTAGANAAAAGAATANDLNLEQKKSAEELALNQASEAQKENQSILQKIFDKQQDEPTRAELRQDYENEFNIKARTAEINSLQQDLDKVMNDVSNQEAVAKDRLGTNDFINNQIAQIRRNSEPIINQLSSEIKWKTGLLTEDRALMNEAISDALADSRNRIENMKWFYNENSQYLDGKYKEALSAKIKMEDREYEQKQATAEYARDIVLAYAKEGIKINIKPTDSIEEINAKVQQNPFPQKSSGGGSSSKVESSVREDLYSLIYDQNLSPEDAYTRLRTLYSRSEISDSALKQIVGTDDGTQLGQDVMGGVSSGALTIDGLYNSLFK